MHTVHMVRANSSQLKLSKYETFHNGHVQQDSFECLLLSMDIMDNGFILQGLALLTLS